MDPQRRPKQSIERHRHGVQGLRHGYPMGLGRVCSEVVVSDVVFHAPSMLRVQYDTAGHHRQQDRWLGGSDNGRLQQLLRVMRGLDRYPEFLVSQPPTLNTSTAKPKGLGPRCRALPSHKCQRINPQKR